MHEILQHMAKETRPDSQDEPGCSLDWKPSSIPNGPSFHFNLHLLLLELFRRHFPACFNFDTTCNVSPIVEKEKGLWSSPPGDLIYFLSNKNCRIARMLIEK
ncbi:hypothetical protein FQN60_013146 [Etheostoma spectabile]|uniref:Uncharacterized protein n=1 Tax=Etheostoma spectabile TaxID=54343 RepID=A0A5J5DCQ6_9PERO|nr:hypothetical protein FQN60_013146 [Etheostoma spectabile]